MTAEPTSLEGAGTIRAERDEASTLDGRWLEALVPTSTMAAAVAAFAWEKTSLGPPSTWPVTLRIAASLCLTSRFPMFLAWGPDLVMLYNEGYRAMLQEKHPAALGAPASQVWSEVWSTIGPLFEQVLGGGPATWVEHQRLEVERAGFVEEAYFTYSYSPVLAPDGSVVGVLDVAAETTREVVDRLRLACLGDLAVALMRSTLVTDVAGDTVRALASTPLITSTDVYLLAEGEPVLVATTGKGRRADAERAAVAEVAAGRDLVVVDPEWLPDRPTRQVALRVGGGGAEGVLVLGLNQHQPFDHAHRRFVDLLAVTIGAALDAADRRAVELGEQRRISTALQRAMLDPASDLVTVAARYRPATGNLFVGGDWYDVIRLDEGRRALVVGDCVGKGLEAATVMGQLRSAIRALLLEGASPARVLESMDRFAATLEGALSTTVACVVVDTGIGQATYSCAGHPPPLLVRASEFQWLDGGRGTPLAVLTDTPRTEATLATRPGDLLVLYSDGLVERPGSSIDVGLDRLAQAATRLAGEDLQVVLDGLLTEMDASTSTDDVVLVVKRVPPAPD